MLEFEVMIQPIKSLQPPSGGNGEPDGRAFIPLERGCDRPNRIVALFDGFGRPAVRLRS
jgi:hypothetical protein